MSKTRFEIAGRGVGDGASCFVIAEAGVNHNGDLARARELIDVAADAGADAVKFQTFQSDQVVAPLAAKARYQAETTGDDGSQLSMIRGLELDYEAFDELRGHSADRDIIFLSTPFDHDSVRYLSQAKVPAFKVGSGDITNVPLLRDIAGRGRPVILSTGMSTLAEVDEAMSVVEAAGCEDVAILHCVSSYPTAPEEVNLRAMATMSQAFGRPVGFSDHTIGIDITLAAVAMGAALIEKHFTLDKTLPGPDHRASLEPGELVRMMAGIRAVESALGNGRKVPAESEADCRAVARRSLFVLDDVAPGEVINSAKVIALRPGGGISPRDADAVCGRRAARVIKGGEMLQWQDLEAVSAS
ncbi:MAG: N-acetylneuraminate synthase [Alphaproteobacteria bacterium]